MFCPFCGQPDATPGLKCVRCGEELPRGKGGTLAVDAQPDEDLDQPLPPPEAPASADAPMDLAATAPSGGVPIAPAARAAVAGVGPEPFVPQISRHAVSHAGDDPEERALVPEPLPTPRPIAAMPPVPAVRIVTPGQGRTAPAADLAVTRPAYPSAPDVAAQVGHAVEPAAAAPVSLLPESEGRAGLVARTLSGSLSLLSGSVLLILFFFLLSAWMGGMRIHEAPALAPGVLALAAGLTGVLELTAGLRMLAGSPAPHATYALSFFVQAVCSAAAVLLCAWDRFAHGFRFRNDIWFLAAVLAAALVLPLVRIAAMIVPASARALGARGLERGVPVRAVPFVLWAPVTSWLAGPLAPLLVVGSIVALSRAVRQDDVGGMMVGLAAAFVFGAVLIANLVAGIALARRTTWSVALGGIAGLLGTVLGVAAVAVPAVMIALDRPLLFDAVGVMASLSLVISAIVTPSVVLAAGAIKFRFRLPPYVPAAGPPSASPRDRLLEILVPPPPTRP